MYNSMLDTSKIRYTTKLCALYSNFRKLRAASHYGCPSREAMGLNGQTLMSPKKWAENSQKYIGIRAFGRA
jgi:hypothetical protein